MNETGKKEEAWVRTERRHPHTDCLPACLPVPPHCQRTYSPTNLPTHLDSRDDPAEALVGLHRPFVQQAPLRHRGRVGRLLTCVVVVGEGRRVMVVLVLLLLGRVGCMHHGELMHAEQYRDGCD